MVYSLSKRVHVIVINTAVNPYYTPILQLLLSKDDGEVAELKDKGKV